MKVLVVLSALVACSLGSAVIPAPYLGYGGLTPYASGYWGGLYGGYGYLGANYLNAGVRVLNAPVTTTIASAPLVRNIVAAPAPIVAPAPVVAPAPIVPAAPAVVKSQYHSQDELGQAVYGHTEPFQTHHTSLDAYGNRVGSYSYLNPHDGKVHRTDYVADALGYRVVANDLPVAPVDTNVAPVDTNVAPVFDGVAPEPVQDTPEVAEARAAHLKAIDEAKSRSRRSTPASTAPLATLVAPAPLTYAAPLPIASHAIAAPALTYAAAPALSYAAAPLSIAAPAPLAYAAAPAPLAIAAPAPAVREATLTTIVNNPGHAVSYRVD